VLQSTFWALYDQSYGTIVPMSFISSLDQRHQRNRMQSVDIVQAILPLEYNLHESWILRTIHTTGLLRVRGAQPVLMGKLTGIAVTVPHKAAQPGEQASRTYRAAVMFPRRIYVGHSHGYVNEGMA
jgi:hypothetical protein